MEAVQHFEAMA